LVLKGINSAFTTTSHDRDVQLCSELSDSLDNSVPNQLFSETQSNFSSTSSSCTSHVIDSDKEITSEDSIFVSSKKSYSHCESTSSSDDVERIYKKCRAKSTHNIYERPKKSVTPAQLGKRLVISFCSLNFELILILFHFVKLKVNTKLQPNL